MFSRLRRYFAFGFTLALAALLTSPCRSDERNWSFNSENFNNRLTADWLMQDEPDAPLRGAYFTPDANVDAQRELIARVLAQLDDGGEFDAEYGADALPYATARGSEGRFTPDENFDPTSAGVKALNERFAALVDAKEPADSPKWRELYRSACLIRRARRLARAVEYAPKIVYTKHYVIGGSHYAYTEDVTDEAKRDFSCNRQPGGQLCLATFEPDGTIKNEVLIATAKGTIRDPDVSWDGKKILFSMRDHYETDDFHIYEYDVEKGTTRQITYGLGVADIEPIYLPNGDILFGSTRCGQITDCWWTEVSNFYTCDIQGRFMRRVSVDQVTVNYPKLLDDGRIVYTRWDYNDRGQIYPQPLFQMNADGTGQTEFYGNNSYFPTTILHARGIPGSDQVVAIASGHHTNQDGKLILIDRSKGTQENTGATLIAPVRETPADKIDQYGQVGELFQYPYPLDDSTLLCAYIPEGGAWSYQIPFGLYWFDFDGARELLAYDPEISCGQPIALAEREKPTTRPSQVDLTKDTGEYYVQDVYEGPGLEGIERGTIKALRVVNIEFRGAGIRSNGNGGPAGGAMICTPIAVGGGTWDVKHVLGVVPVEEDGSAYFEVPALTPVYFQLLDKNGDVVQTMRSWSTLQPGETFGCVGCHEPKGSVIENATSADGSTSIALKKGVAKLTPELRPGAGRFHDAGFSFTRDIQPILDHHCVRCHTGGTVDGKKAPFSLLGNLDVTQKGTEICEKSGRTFSESYLNLSNYGVNAGSRARWINIQEGPAMLPPYKEGASTSPVIKLFRDKDGNVGGQDENHKDVRIDKDSLRLLAMWMDLLVPYCGDYTEENNWTPEENAHYVYYLTKRANSERIVAQNVGMLVQAQKTGVIPDFDKFQQLTFGGLDDRKAFFESYPNRHIPSVARREGNLNVYRNVALNPGDIQGDAYTLLNYPHATSNSEYAYLDEFAAKNAIDGKKENKGHGPKFPSWGPNLRTDLWLNVDFGCEVEIDKAVIYVRADFPHDDVWKSATLEFSDGSREKIELKATAEPQTFEFKKRRVTSVKLTDLEASFPLKWSGITEIEYWGTSVE
ncbi:MAG: hypothetical protein IJM54_11465 [Thermoguttaceae bacterium]|nr:hypothetical protein [Thermoguttaceae bacterium]